MKKIFASLIIALTLLPALALFPAAKAQCNGVFPAHTLCGNNTSSPNIPGEFPASALTNIVGGTNGQTQYNNSGTLGGYTWSGDATVIPSTGVVTVSGINGQPVPTGNATNCIYANSAGQLNGTTYPCTPRGTSVTANYNIAATDCYSTLYTSGGFFTVTIPTTVTGFPSGCIIIVINTQTWGTGRGTALAMSNASALPGNLTPGQGIVWPTGRVAIQLLNGVWQAFMPEGRTKLAISTVNFYANFNNTNGDNAGNDCLSATISGSTGPCHSVQFALFLGCNEFDFVGSPQTLFTVNAAAAVADTSGVHYACHGETGAQGGAAMTLDCGSGATITGTNTDAIAAEVGAKLAVVGCTLSAGGTVTNSTRTADCIRSDYTGSTVFAINNIFSVCGGADYAADEGAVIIVDSNDTVEGNTSAHFHAAHNGVISTDYVNVGITTSAPNALTITIAWALAETGGVISVQSWAYAGPGTVTGLKEETIGTGAIYTAAGNSACIGSFFPGSTNGTTAAPFCL